MNNYTQLDSGLTITLLDHDFQTDEERENIGSTKKEISLQILIISNTQTEIMTYLQSITPNQRNESFSCSSTYSNLITDNSDIEYQTIKYKINNEIIIQLNIYKIPKESQDEIYFNFLRSSFFILLVFDSNSKESFEQILEIFNHCKKFCDNPTKCGLVGIQKENIPQKDKLKIDNKIKDFNFDFYEEIKDTINYDISKIFNKILEISYFDYNNSYNKKNDNSNNIQANYNFLSKDCEDIEKDIGSVLAGDFKEDIKRVNQKKCCCSCKII